MTNISADKEKAPTEGKRTGNPGATLITFAGYAAIGILVGLVIAVIVKDGVGQGAPTGVSPVLLIVFAPLIIGVIQRTTTDKPVTWYRREAQIAGIVLGAIAAFLGA